MKKTFKLKMTTGKSNRRKLQHCIGKRLFSVTPMSESSTYSVVEFEEEASLETLESRFDNVMKQFIEEYDESNSRPQALSKTEISEKSAYFAQMMLMLKRRGDWDLFMDIASIVGIVATKWELPILEDLI